MAHDIFISYAQEDREVAKKVNQALKDAGYKTWIAPDSIPPGKGYAGAIAEAIASVPVMVLVHSEHSNNSEHILNEVNLAANTGRRTRLIPFRIANIDYNPDLLYYLARTQWVEAWEPPVEAHLQPLVDWVRQIHPLPAGDTPTPRPPDRPTPAPPPQPLPEKGLPVKWLAAGAGALLLVAVFAVIAYNAMSGGGETNENRGGGGVVASVSPAPPNPSPTPAAQQTPQVNPTATPLLTPTPARATPTPSPSPRPVPPRNVNLRLPTNSVVGPVNRPPEEEVPDWQIKAQIEKRMATHDQLSGVKVDVVKGVVTLSGTVPDADWRSTAQMLSKIKGVKDVRNDLKHN